MRKDSLPFAKTSAVWDNCESESYQGTVELCIPVFQWQLARAHIDSQNILHRNPKLLRPPLDGPLYSTS